MLKTNEDENTVGIFLPALNHIFVFFLRHCAIHFEER
jgi:hypothetical protein